MTWSYVVAYEIGDDGSDVFSIREMYTDPDGSLSWTAPVPIHGIGWTDLVIAIGRCADALTRPILDLTSTPAVLISMTALRARESARMRAAGVAPRSRRKPPRYRPVVRRPRRLGATPTRS